MENGADRHRQAGFAAGLSAYLIWGLLPVYLKALKQVSPNDVLAYRVLWAVAFCAIIALAAGRARIIRDVLRDGRRLLLLTASSLIIGLNWLIYIWAINSNHVLEASLGYFINPLISVLFGVVLFRERLGRAGWVAVTLAAVGVAVLALAKGALPWVSLGLALTFAVYSAIRKYVPVEAVAGLFVETLILAPGAALWLYQFGQWDFTREPAMAVLLAMAGPITAVPLILFAVAARRLPLITIGLMQYLTPTMVFLLGVFIYREPLGVTQLFAFACIWAGLAVYAADAIRKMRRRPLA